MASLRRTGARRRVASVAIVAVGGLGLGLVSALPSQAAAEAGGRAGSSADVAATCPDVDVVFARGTNEDPGLGTVGGPFVAGVEADLPGETVADYAVDYPANITQLGAEAGANDMSEHVIDLAAQCPDTLFILGGYSQGAIATDIAVGIPVLLYFGATIPASLAPRVAAVVTFGNPLHLTGTSPAEDSPTYAERWDDFCADGDPICAGGLDFGAHLTYVSNGDAAAGAVYAAVQVLLAEG